MKDSILESLENMYLVKQHASEYKVELTDEEKKKIDKAAEEFVEDNTLEDKEVVSGYKKYVKEYLELATIQQKMDAPMKEGVDENVSDEDAAQKKIEYVQFSYTKKDDSGQSVQMTDDEKKAEKEKAQTFLDTVSADPDKDMNAAAASAEKEVQTATFDSESSTLNADLLKAADALENVGDVTSLIETDDGIYVAKLTSKLDREATDQKKKEIVEERKQKQYEDQVETWRKETDIKVDKKEWKDAIKRDTLDWEQVCDFSGLNSEIAKQYTIKQIPANILLSADGKILAKNLSGEDLKKKIEEVVSAAEEKDKKDNKKKK